MKLGADLEATKKEQQHTICIISKLYVLDLCQKNILTVYLKQKIASPKTSDILRTRFIEKSMHAFCTYNFWVWVNIIDHCI
jgi:ribonucleotide reductase beta subunit family protein with ferritin-like domain